MQVVYFLPKFTFFKNKLRGRTSHAHGFLSGLRKNSINCLLVSGPGYSELYDADSVNNLVYAPPALSRINFLWVAFAAIRTLSNSRINSPENILVVRYSTSVAFLTSLLFGFFWKGKTIYEINSIGYHQIKSNSKRLLKLILALEKQLIAAFDIALCVSNNIRLDIQNPKVESFVLPNGSSTPAVQLKDIARPAPRFIYLGAYQPYYDFKQLFSCFLQANTNNAELHIYGDKNKYLAEDPKLINHTSIKLKGPYNLNQLLARDCFSRRDIFILPLGHNRMSRIGSPTKLFEYLSFGVRIIYLDYGQAGDILNTLTNVYPYQDDKSLINALELSAQQAEREFRSPVTESEYNNTYTWQARVKLFLAHMGGDSGKK